MARLPETQYKGSEGRHLLSGCRRRSAGSGGDSGIPAAVDEL